MQTYYKIYHYTKETNELDYIDPAFYGTSISRYSECKRGKIGLNKSFFYTCDEPETCVASGAKRYEIYLPFEWKPRIYDRGTDCNDYYQQVKFEILERGEFPYERSLLDGIEEKIKEEGYVGWCNTASTLPHAIVLFEKISTQKPKNFYKILDWSERMIEYNENVNFNSIIPSTFFYPDRNIGPELMFKGFCPKPLNCKY